MPDPAPLNTAKTFTAELVFVPAFNLALQQNALPVAYELKLANKGEEDLAELECRFSSVPEFIREKTLFVEQLKAGEETALNELGLELNYELLSGLSESMKGKLQLTVCSGGKELFRREYDCEAFAPDQWLGTQTMPELLASFVTPNLEPVIQLQSAAARELERATGSPSIEGYQADKKRVYETCSAIYGAIHDWGIQYSNPPASFGAPGQRVRFADTIYQYKLGTCLETTLLFASVMEACGLFPVILLQKSHAYVGCHLVERYFPDIPLDDLQTIRKLADLDEFLVIETTMVTGKATFAEAEAAARFNNLNIDGDFECAIDVTRARYSGIRPLPLKRSVNGMEFAPVERRVEHLDSEPARQLERGIDLSRLSSESIQPPRVVRWTKKLLDLSLRNRLLNVRETKFVIPIACPDITVLEDKIAANETLSLNSLHDLLNEKDLHDLAMLRNSDVKTDIKLLLEKELSQRRLRTLLPPVEMNRRLVALYRQGKTDLEESGVNTLYLAIGFVEWKVAERDERSYLAPILLLPVHLQRRSIVEGIRISRFDGDTIINETLLELLRSQYHLTIPGLAPLPTDDSGVDVGLVMQIFREAIRDMKGWEVREEARIGHFSFGKFVMWTDMTARLEVLKQTPLIAHLISGDGLFDDGIEVFPPEKINEHLDPARLFCPVSADSSQLTAVLYSELGKNFVLHGPPGTGKSQTITNIIAHNLALGRRVLFVSEKKAALDVVHRRLSRIGLKPFCLELHSNKSGKAEVLAQFEEVLQLAEARPPADWQAAVSTLNTLRGELDSYVAELHRPSAGGFSAYDCFSYLLGRGGVENAPSVTPDFDPLACSRESYDDARRKFIALAECRRSVEEESLKTFASLEHLQWSPVLQNDLLEAARQLRTAAGELLKKFAVAAACLALDECSETGAIYRTAVILETVKNSDDIPEAFFSDDFREKAAFISDFADNARQLRQLKEKLACYHLEKFAEFDFPGIAERIARNEKAFFLIRFIKNNALLKELSVLKKSGGVKLSLQEVKTLLPDAEQYVVRQGKFDAGRNKAAELLGRQWNDGDADWDALKGLIDTAGVILDQLQEITRGDDGRRRKVLEKLRELMPAVSSRCGQRSPLRGEINTLLEAWNAFQEALAAFRPFSVRLAAPEAPAELAEALAGIIGRIAELRNVLRYRNLRREVADAGLEKAADCFEKEPEPADPADFFDRMFFKSLLDRILGNSPLLSRFSGDLQNKKITAFAEFDARCMELTRKMIFARLAANLPRRRSGPCPEGTELGTLKRECEKRARQKPVRLLLEQIPYLASKLKPCFLMSPLSVAQYLPPDSAPFDLIVFDEASQIPVWDAIGVIARGKQLIVVGDPKQMPPTNFFQKGESDDDAPPSDETEDMESILDECIASGVHSTYLNWHYRSRHESLIAFSNHHYYGDRLCTFPAARSTEKLGVRFQFVPDGVYDRKGSRTNLKEAEALVRYVFDRLEHAGGRYRSIGIVTFSQAQQELIEDLLEKERTRHPALESCFDDTQPEPLFVKNLENVQGDERDVILFSTGYAPDASGRFSMNFGPLNRQGGERRLNVAITRAKEQIVVFSSIHAEQIDLTRTNAVGAAHLKYFLDYAEKKISVAAAGNRESSPDGLVGTIADFLTGKGFAVERGVGCSGSRIDLAVRDPAAPKDFLLGIECDNDAYAAQRTARDRDSLRRQVLEGLGWHTCRVWSIDWALDRKRAERELLELIEKLRNAPSEPPPEPREAAPTPGPAAEESAESPAEEQETPPAASAAPLPVPENRKEYLCWQSSAVLLQESFYEPAGREMIRRQMAEIIEREAPICEQLLKRRITRAWGFTRAGDNIRKILDECLPRDLEVTRTGESRVFWAPGLPSSAYRFYRVGVGEENRRAVDDIPPEELANAMYEVLMDFHSCEKDTLFRETIRLFGLSAVTAKARKYLEYGLAVLQKTGRI